MSPSLNQRDENGNIIYPFLPLDRIIKYAPASDPFMEEALEEVAKMEATHPEVNRPTAAILVKDGRVVAKSRNGSIHKTFCPRVCLNSPSGQEYEYCPNHCHGRNHAEATTVRKAKEAGIDTTGADLYLAGHWWACKSCWDSMIEGKINDLFLVEDAHTLYDEVERRQTSKPAGVLKSSASVLIKGDEAERFRAWLQRVGFVVVSDSADAQATILLPGADDITENPTQVYDYRKENDLKAILTRLSEDLTIPD